jgi:TorA maturation chaperone TorD
MIKPMDENALITQFRSHVAEDLQILAVLQKHEITQTLLKELKQVNFPDNFGLRLQTSEGEEACELIRKVMINLPETIDLVLLDDLAADFAAIYLNNSFHASPYESVWLSEDHLIHEESMFEVRKWYEKYNLVAENWRTMADDHIALQLQFLAHLFSLNNKQETLEEAARFLDEHLLQWVEQFTHRVAARCQTPFYAGLNLFVAQYLKELREILAEILAV